MIAMLGWIGSGLVVVSLVQHDVRRLRQLNLVACAALVIFNVALGITSMIALNVVLAGVNGYHLARGRADASGAVATSPHGRGIPVDCRAADVVGLHEARAAIERRRAVADHQAARLV